jgi:hypothetical protein
MQLQSVIRARKFLGIGVVIAKTQRVMPKQPKLFSVIICTLTSSAFGQVVLKPDPARIEQSRQMELPKPNLQLGAKPTATDAEIQKFDSGFDDAFGAQVILKENIVVKPFTGWVEVTGLYTNNVALTRRGELDDTFLSSTFGISYRKAIKPTIAFDASLRVSLFRYNRFNELDFQSLDPSVSLTWTPEKLKNTAFYTRYGFNQLTAASSGDELFNSHNLAFGVQKIWPVGRTHAVIAGAQAQVSWADPSDNQRNEYSVYVGYHADLTEKASADVNYRYAFFDYRELEGGRQDHNHGISLSLRYALEEWLSVSATSTWTTNKSNRDAFGYDAFNAGGSLGLSAKF